MHQENPSVALAASFLVFFSTLNGKVLIKTKDSVVLSVRILSCRVGQQRWFSTEYMEIMHSASCGNVPKSCHPEDCKNVMGQHEGG